MMKTPKRIVLIASSCLVMTHLLHSKSAKPNSLSLILNLRCKQQMRHKNRFFLCIFLTAHSLCLLWSHILITTLKNSAYIYVRFLTSIYTSSSLERRQRRCRHATRSPLVRVRVLADYHRSALRPRGRPRGRHARQIIRCFAREVPFVMGSPRCRRLFVPLGERSVATR